LLDDKKNDTTDLGKRESKRDALVKHLCKLQDNIRLYTSGDFNEFLRKTDFKPHLKSIAKKKELKDKIESLLVVGDKKIGQVIQEADEFGICEIDDYLLSFMDKKKYVYDQVAEVPYKEFQLLYEYLEGFTPFSTKHKTKGSEFDNVLVILDNGNWNKYNFENLFVQAIDNNALIRSQKIFYVCCTRAKESLAIFYHNPSPAVLTKATEWFGEKNVISL
jgi:DNA helicase-2/ATP-dependent DNA helicase PcrA